MSDFLITYGRIIIGIIILLLSIIFFIPSNALLTKIREWLLWAVTEAEKNLGSGTGEIKLRYVYNKFIEKFPFISKIISFEKFEIMVDDALDKFEELLNKNKKLQDFINKEEK